LPRGRIEHIAHTIFTHTVYPLALRRHSSAQEIAPYCLACQESKYKELKKERQKERKEGGENEREGILRS
jgi:hypothetical protein